MHSFRAFNACTTWFDSKDYTQQKHALFVAETLHREETHAFGVWRTNELKVQTQFNFDSIKMIFESIGTLSINAHYHL